MFSSHFTLGMVTFQQHALLLCIVLSGITGAFGLKCGTGAKFVPIHCMSDNLIVMKITEANTNSWNEDQECMSFDDIEMVR